MVRRGGKGLEALREKGRWKEGEKEVRGEGR